MCVATGARHIVMEWMGMHALMIFVLIACNVLPVILFGFYWEKPENNIVIPLSFFLVLDAIFSN